MNDCVYAIPGLMPPTAPKWNSVINTPEDGSLLLCIHVGKPTDNVTWAVDILGRRHGVVKDPAYAYTEWNNTPVETPEKSVPVNGEHDTWRQFMIVSNELPGDCIMPAVSCNGVSKYIDELYYGDVAPTYWYLDMPIRSLPVGDSKVEVCINGVVRTYVVQRPAYAVHSKHNLSHLYINAGK